jgi:endonuclease YncB( thermonuclease family)
MKYFGNKTIIFFAIIIAGFIIGGFCYFGLKYSQKTTEKADVGHLPTSQGIATSDVAMPSCQAAENTIVTKVIDGDTVVVEGGYHVRLIGMDADEKGYTCYDSARIRIEELVLGKMVKLEKDISDTDKYGRCLRYIFINNINVDVLLVKEGLAVARFYEPDVKYKAEIAEAEKQAIANKAGCKWAK